MPIDRRERQRHARRAAGGVPAGVPRAIGRAGSDARLLHDARRQRRRLSRPTDVGPLVDADPDPEPAADDTDEKDEPLVLSTLSIMERMKLAMKGTKGQRAQLIRDSNKLVAAAVLSSPKLTESEVEAFAKMANVSEETLRTIAMNRSWAKNYGVIAGLTRNPKTPVAIAMQMVHRLNDRDLKALMTDRNVQEVVRLTARRLAVKGPKASD